MKARAKYTKKEVLDYHSKNSGKIETVSKAPLKTFKQLSMAYTPGVAEVCLEIEKNKEKLSDYTNRDNLVAVVTDGTAVLGLGDVGPEAALPVMEGKCMLFKNLAGVDAVPICMNTKNAGEIADALTKISPGFAGINLEDIAAPHCFEVEKQLKQNLNIPIFHDDQHGTAVVTLAGLLNSLKLVGKKISQIKVAVSGAGAAGIACSKFYLSAGVKDIILCDSAGTIYSGRKQNMNPYKQEIAKITNKSGVEGTLADAMNGADVFLGVSAANIVTPRMIRLMADDSIIFACANPTPEIMPQKAIDAGAKIVATGRSDFPNQLNNVLGFPGIFRGALDVKATAINEPMKLAAAKAIAATIPDSKLTKTNIIPSPLDSEIMPREAEAVARAAIKTKVARKKTSPKSIYTKTKQLVKLNKNRKFP